MLRLSIPLTSYVARHSWATTAKDNDELNHFIEMENLFHNSHNSIAFCSLNGMEREKPVHFCLFNNSLTYKVMDTNTLLLTR